MYQGTTLQNDSETQAKLFDWFQFRELNYEDDKFLVMYKRNLDMYYPKYKVLLEDELKEIPELINYKREMTNQLRNYGSITDELARIIKRDNERIDNLTSITDMTRKDTGSISNSETDVLNGLVRNDNNLKQTSNANSKSNSSDNASSHVKGNSDSKGHDDSKGMIRQLPQSSEYAAGGFPEKLDWTTGSQQAEDIVDTNSHVDNESSSETESNGETSASSSSSVINTGYTLGSSSQTNEYSKIQNNNNQSKDEGTVKNIGTQNNNESLDEDTKNIKILDDKHDSFGTSKGFYGMTEAEIRRLVWSFVSNSIALQWFLHQMDACFIGVFEDEDDERSQIKWY